jgi:hypothetical protein
MQGKFKPLNPAEAQLVPIGLPKPVQEYWFHPTRNWRFDYAWPNRKVAIEIDGGTWIQGRHNRGSSFWAEKEKLNEAASMNWLVLHYPPGRKGDFKLAKVDWDQVARTLLAPNEV